MVTVMNKVIDRDEHPSLMEPLLIPADSGHRAELTDLVVELAARSTGLRRSLPKGVLTALADLVRSMNCYYSNLIEGHDTHPVDIERALRNDYSSNLKKRNLQLEAKAHIQVQQWIDSKSMKSRATSTTGLCDIHRRFCEQLPEELLWTEDPDTSERLRVIPGKMRDRVVRVGQHISVSPGALPRFMQRFDEVFSSLGKTETLIAAAAAHHRLLWIHPFFDGNGRVARLMSHAMLGDTLDTGGTWSVARGLARNVGAYKNHLANCDLERRNDLDGRGNLSQEELISFSIFFLQTCLDQVTFMERLVQPDRLRHRILAWAREEADTGKLPPKAERVLEAMLYQGQLSRSEVAGILDLGERQARRIVVTLTDQGILHSDSARGPLRLVFPATLAAHWMPGLFPENAG